MEHQLANIASRIAPLDERARTLARARWNAIAKPIGGLGSLETMIEDIAALSGSPAVSLDKRAVVVFCADNGVVAQGVSQCGPDITTLIAGNIARGTSSVCRMAEALRADAFAVDVGMITPSPVPGVIDRRIAAGTSDISTGPAMSTNQALCAIQTGIDLAEDFASQGYQALVAGEMGIGNTTTASALAAAFFDAPVDMVAGRGAGLSAIGLQRKQQAITQALAVNAPDANNSLETLAKLGGFDIAGMAGLFIGGACFRVPVIIDGFISAIAAYIAYRLAPDCRTAMLASHVSSEPAAALALDALNFRAVINAGMHLGEGTGGLCLLPLLDAALSLYNGTTFADIGMDAYEVYAQ